MDFSDTEEDKLINQVAQYPALYDASHKNYVNTVIKDHIWKKIGEDLNKSDEDCKKKWKSIRDSYIRFKKNTKLGTGSAAPKRTKQKRHLQLSFLDSVPHHRSGGTSVTPHQELDINNENVSVEQEPVTSVSSDTQQEDEVEVSTEATDEEPSFVEATISKKKKTEDTFLKIWKQRDEQRQALYKNIVKRMDDDIDLFCRHIGEVLRNLPPYEKAKAKKHLGEVLSDYEIMAASRSYERNTSSSLSQYDSTSNDHASSSESHIPSPPCSHNFIQSYSPHRTTETSTGPRPALLEPGSAASPRQENAPSYFQLQPSPNSTATASPRPFGSTSGLGYVLGHKTTETSQRPRPALLEPGSAASPRQENAPSYFQLQPSPNSTATASPRPFGSTSGLGYVPGHKTTETSQRPRPALLEPGSAASPRQENAPSYFQLQPSPNSTATASPRPFGSTSGLGYVPGHKTTETSQRPRPALLEPGSAASPRPLGTTWGLGGYVPGPVHYTSYASSPMQTEVGSPSGPTDLSFRVNQMDREEENDFVDES